MRHFSEMIKIAAFFAVILIFAVQFGSAQNSMKADWTLMFYMDSDNNLEDPQMEDLTEMMAVGSSANINLVVLADRSVKGDSESGYTDRAVGGIKNWTTAKLMVIEKGRLRELADWGEVNMGDPATLRKFLQAVTTQFPANRFGLIFGDHGAGWVGISGDESADGDSLTAAELPPVLKDITAASGRFDLIGFDACLMANFESAKAIAPFGKTMVASEELEPGNGWNYTPLLTSLAQNPKMDGAALGKRVVETFRDYYLGPNAGNRDKSVTLAAIDLDKIPALETAVNNLSVRNLAFMRTGGRNTWLKTARARNATEEFGVHEGTHFDYYDLVDYAEKLKQEQPDAETIRSADAVIAAVRAAVLIKINGEGHPRSGGLSIYFPPNTKTSNGDYRTTPFSLTGKWFPFLVDYLGISTSDKQAPVVEEVASTDTDIAKNDVVTVTARVKADDVAEASFVLAESHANEQIIIGAIPAEPDEKGVLHEEWDGSWFSIGDNEKEVICPITNFEELDEAQDTYMAEVPAQIRYRGKKDWHDVTLYFYLDFNDEDVVGEFVYAFEFNGEQAREIGIRAGDSIRPVYLSIDNKGEASMVASDDEDDIFTLKKADDLTVGRTDVDAGDYLIGFTVTDFADNTSEKFEEVTIK